MGADLDRHGRAKGPRAGVPRQRAPGARCARVLQPLASPSAAYHWSDSCSSRLARGPARLQDKNMEMLSKDTSEPGAALAPADERGALAKRPRRPHVIVVGGGFAGLNCVRQLSDTSVDVTL